MSITIEHKKVYELTEKEEIELKKMKDAMFPGQPGSKIALPVFIAKNEKGEMIAFMEHTPAKKPGDDLLISEAYVHPDYRGEKIANKLYDKIEQHARENNVRDIVALPVSKEGKRLFQRKGGQVIVSMRRHDQIEERKREGHTDPFKRNIMSIEFWKRITGRKKR